jgi:hypothetical protein
MKRILSASLLFYLLLSFTSCIEFESQELTYRHDQKEDALLVTLRYEGIYGSTKAGGFAQAEPNDFATAERLNQKQVGQLSSVLDGNRAFFFSNWIFEYDRNTLAQMLERVIVEPVPEGKVFGQPEKDLIEALLNNVDVRNVGFYKDDKGRLCGAQTLKITNLSKIISLANQVIRRQQRAHLPEMRKQVKNAMSKETIDLIAKKMKGDYSFIQIEGNLITLQSPMVDPDTKRISESLLKDLPEGSRIESGEDSLAIKIGDKTDNTGALKKKCFDDYLPNALNYLQKEHPKLFVKPEQLEKALVRFLSN